MLLIDSGNLMIMAAMAAVVLNIVILRKALIKADSD
jgi:hypothetical protein